MAFTLTFTCIPLGLQGEVGNLDLLVSPMVDSVTDLASLSGWTQAVLDHADDFALTNIGQITIDRTLLKVDLWKKLFGSVTRPGQAANPPVGKPGSVRVSPRGVSLSMTRSELDHFHKTWIARTSNLANQRSQRDSLKDIHAKIIANHALYAPPEAPPHPPTPHRGGEGPTTGQFPPVVLHQPQGVALPNETSRLVSSRLGLDVSVVTHAVASQQAETASERPSISLSTPQKVLDALPALIFNVSASLQTATGLPVDLSSAPAEQAHLLYHLDRISSASSAANRARMAAQAGKDTEQIDFHEQISLLMSMPALMEAVGLVLHGTVPKSKLLAITQSSTPIKIDVPGFFNSMFPSGQAITAITMTNTNWQVPAPGQAFTPSAKSLGAPAGQMNSILLPSGYFDPRDHFDWGCQQLDSGTTQAVGFANHSAMRQTAVLARGGADPSEGIVQNYDEDIDHPVLPPSPVTGGLQVWQSGKQADVSKSINNADTVRAAASAANPPTYWAEDLINGTVADIFVAANQDQMSTPLDLCRRDETYYVDQLTIEAKQRERGVRVSATRRFDGGVPQAYEIDETIVNWRLGSLVAPVRSPKDGSHPPHIKPTRPTSSQQIPWSSQGFRKNLASLAKQESPLFGQNYMAALRPAFVSGGVIPYNLDAARKAALGPIPFLRYELVQGPTSIPVNNLAGFLKDHETATFMIIASKIVGGKLKWDTKLSQRVLAPAAIKEEVARRHAIPQRQLDDGSKVLPLRDGVLPPYLPNADWQQGEVAYLPDPLCIGLIATLTDLDGAIVDAQELEFYSDTAWPTYTPHLIELEGADDGQASLKPEKIGDSSIDIFTRASRKLHCRIPRGNTYLLNLQPKLRQDFFTLHALATSIQGIVIPPTGQQMSSEQMAQNLQKASNSDVCRPTFLRLTHATDLPISEANLVLPSTFDRQPGAKFAISGSAHAESTATVEVLSEWNDQDDDPQQSDPALRNSHAKLIEFTVPKRPKTLPNAQFSADDVRLPFSDGRYRRVTVTPRSLSRFRELFKEKGLSLAGSSYTVDFRATAKPSAPDIELVLPNFAWNVSDPRNRSMQQGLTLIHNRGWFSSGNHEQLAILTSPVMDGSEPFDTLLPISKVANAENNHSAWGLLPDWAADAPHLDEKSAVKILPCTKSFPKEMDPDGQTMETQATISVGSNKYRAMLFTPEYNRHDNQWYFDINFKSGPPAIGAVMRLVVARYQAHATPGNELSNITACDFANVWPDRTITISRPHWWSKDAVVRIFGVGSPQGSSNPCEGDEKPTSDFEVRRAWRGGPPQNGFTWSESKPVPADPKPWNNAPLWQGTIPLGVAEDHVLIIRERAVFRDAESPSQDRSCTIFLDAFRL